MRFTTRPELHGTFGAISSTHWIATSVGMSLLERGHTAFDAAVASGFTLQVVEPHLNGPAGEVPILVTPAGADRPIVIAGQGPLPLAATPERMAELGIDLIPGTGLLAACVPGAFGAWLTLLRDHGTAELEEVLAPAIHYARHGHPLVPRIANTIAQMRELFETHWPTSAATYLPGGAAPQAGRLFRNPALADTYEAVLAAATGPTREARIEAALDHWYRGPVAEAIDRFCATEEVWDVSGRRNPGLLTADDLAGWTAPIETPLSVRYGEHEVYKCGPWSQGPVLLQMLRLLDGTGAGDLDPEGPDFVHLVAETIKLAMADREAWYGDGGEVPMPALLSEGYAAERRGLVGSEASREVRPGAPDGRTPMLPPLREKGTVPVPGLGGGEPTVAKAPEADLPRDGEAPVKADGAPRGDTCQVSVVDRWGNMVSATPSGGWLQSSPVIPALGFALTTRGQMAWIEQGLNSSLRPGVRPRTTLTPTTVFRGGAPWIACGTPGGDQQDQWQLLMLLRLFHQGDNLQEAIDAPAFHTDHLPSSFWPREIVTAGLTLESRYPQATLDELRRRGHAVTVADAWSEGRLSAVAQVRDGEDRLLRAGANPRGMQGYAIAR